MDAVEYFGLLKSVAAGDILAVLKFFEEDARAVAAFQAIGDVGLAAAIEALEDARASRRPTREIEQAATLLRASHESFKRVLDAEPPGGEGAKATSRDYGWRVKREIRSQWNQARGKWALDADRALAVCRVSAMEAVCSTYLREDRQVERWLDRLRYDFAQFSRFHPEGDPAYGQPIFGNRDLTPFFKHLPYREIKLDVSLLSARLTNLVLSTPET